MYHIVLESAIEMLVPQCITLASSVVEIDACLIILNCANSQACCDVLYVCRLLKTTCLLVCFHHHCYLDLISMSCMI